MNLVKRSENWVSKVSRTLVGRGEELERRTEPRSLGAGLGIPQEEGLTFPTGREGVGRMHTLIFERGGGGA